MSHVHRFYVPANTQDEGAIALPPEEAHHAFHVVRIRAGQRVVLFDGLGREIQGVVTSAARGDVIISAGEVRRVPEPHNHLVLIQAWLHHSKAIENLIQRGTELGVREFRFFRSRYSERAPRPSDKWRRTAIEACKQCGRAWLPTFSVVADVAAALGDRFDSLFIASRDVPASPIHDNVTGPRIGLAVGPEGDFAPEELTVLQDAGGQGLSLGSTTYRSEVAATLAATLLLYELGEFNGRSDRE